ncbi:MAG: diguanylate cyclase with and Cache sensor [Firmicutes bacterium]|nr:diguanylate cyclase with and Cache sensor [Bacillota bacterium]
MSLTRLFFKLMAPYSVRKKLSIAFVIMMVLPIAIMIFITSQWHEQFFTKVISERNRDLAKHLADDIDAKLTEKIKTLKVAAISKEIKSMDKDRQVPILKEFVTQYPDVQLAIVIDVTGKQIARSDDQPLDTTINYSDRIHCDTSVDINETAISDIRSPKTAGTQVVAIAEPIKNDDGTLLGMTIVNIELRTLLERLANAKIGSAGYVYVVNQAGKVIIHPDPNLASVAEDLSQVAPVLAAINGVTGSVEYKYGSQKILAGYSYIPALKWGIVAQQPLVDAMLEGARTRINEIIAMFAAGIIALLFGLTFAGTLSKQLREITMATNRIAQGDFTIQLEVLSPDEFGQLITNFNNMTEQLLKREKALRESEEQYRSLVNNVNIGIYQRPNSMEETLLQVNPAMAKILGYSSVEELLTIPLSRITQSHFGIENITRIEVPEIKKLEVSLRKKDGTLILCSHTETAHYDEIGNVLWFDGVMEDITEQRKAEIALRDSHEELEKRVKERTKDLMLLNEKLEQLSITDGLTGIPNRRYFDDVVGREWQRAKRKRTQLALLMLDVDYFKAYNDTYGHPAGDACLKMIASILSMTVKRSGDFIARYGGEEFAIVLPATNTQGAFAVGEKIREAVQKLAAKHEKSHVSEIVTVSIGGAVTIPNSVTTPQLLIDSADKALYQAKQEGRNCTKIVSL